MIIIAGVQSELLFLGFVKLKCLGRHTNMSCNFQPLQYTNCVVSPCGVDSVILQSLYHNAPSTVQIRLQRVCRTLRKIALCYASQFDSFAEAIRLDCVGSITIMLAGKKLTKEHAVALCHDGCSPYFAKIMFGDLKPSTHPSQLGLMPYLQFRNRTHTWFDQMMATGCFYKTSGALALAQGDAKQMERCLTVSKDYRLLPIWFANGGDIKYAEDPRLSAGAAEYILRYFGQYMSPEIQFCLLGKFTLTGLYVAEPLRKMMKVPGCASVIAPHVRNKDFGHRQVVSRIVIADPSTLALLCPQGESIVFCGLGVEKCFLVELIDKVALSKSLEVAHLCAEKNLIDMRHQSEPYPVSPEMVDWLRNFLAKERPTWSLRHRFANYYVW